MSASTHRFVMSVIPNDDYTKHADGWLKPGLQCFGMLESGRLRPLRSQTNGQIALAGSRRTRLSWFGLWSVGFGESPRSSLPRSWLRTHRDSTSYPKQLYARFLKSWRVFLVEDRSSLPGESHSHPPLWHPKWQRHLWFSMQTLGSSFSAMDRSLWMLLAYRRTDV